MTIRDILGFCLCLALPFMTSCDFMYDDRDEATETVDSDGTFTDVNCTSYTAWTYIKLSTHTATTVEIENEDSIPSDWDFAIHRYTCKTNGGAVMETDYTSIEELLADGYYPEGDFVEDVWSDTTVYIDLSRMMEGILQYQSTYVNLEFSKWMHMVILPPPPSYSMSNKVYILQLKDGTRAAIRFTDYISSSGVKAYNSFNYSYPLNLK